MYLTCSLLYFGLAAVAPADVIRFTETDKKEVGEEALKQASNLTRELGDRFVHDMPRGMFVLMPMLGLLTWTFYRGRQPFYVPHLYYSLHMHAFAFLALSLKTALSFAGRYGAAAGKVLPLVIVAYHYAALRRVFAGARGETAWKGSAIALLYFAALLGTFIGLVLLILWERGMLHAS